MKEAVVPILTINGIVCFALFGARTDKEYSPLIFILGLLQIGAILAATR